LGAKSITSKFTLDAMLTSMSTMLCVEHGAFNRMRLVTVSVRVSRHVVVSTFCIPRPFWSPLSRYGRSLCRTYAVLIEALWIVWFVALFCHRESHRECTYDDILGLATAHVTSF
jgi:hypothetical protein